MGEKQTFVLDASAIIKLVIYEQGSDDLLDYCGEEAVFDTTALCFSGAIGYLKTLRSHVKKAPDDNQYLAVSKDLLELLKKGTLRINHTSFYDKKDWRGVGELIDKYSLDISDAFQIYSIKIGFLENTEKHPNPVLITGDSDLAVTARKEGINVWNCLEDD